MTAADLPFQTSINPAVTSDSLVSFGQTNQVFINTQLPTLTNDWTTETWRGAQPWQTKITHDLEVRFNDKFSFGKIEFPDIDSQGVYTATKLAYEKLAVFLKENPHNALVRIWNLIPNINEGDGDNETYRQFSLARAEIFAGHKELLGEYTAASALGRKTPGLLVYFLASHQTGDPIENPQQVSAYHYPRCHGPASPSFARATLHERILYVSGTAAIEGHASLFPGDIEQQCKLALLNIERVVQAANFDITAGYLRCYLRQPAHLSAAQKMLNGSTFTNLPVIWLQADICRSELLVEFEAVFA